MNSNFQYEAHGMRYRKLTTEFKKSVLQHIKQSYVALSTCKTLQEEKKKNPPPFPPRAFEVARMALASQDYATSRLGLQQRTQRRLLARQNLPDVLKARMPRCLQPGRASKLKPRAY